VPRAPCTFKKRDLKTAVKAVEEQTGRKVARVRISRAGEIVLEMACVGPAAPAPAEDDDPMAARQRELGLLPTEP